MSESNHWYNKDGIAVHQVQGKTVEWRPTNISDARKLSLFPSVSGIIKQWYNPALERYKIQQTIEAAKNYLTEYPIDEICQDEKSYFSFVNKSASEAALNAAKLGTIVHQAIEASFAGNEWDKEEILTNHEGVEIPVKQFVNSAMSVIEEFYVQDSELTVVDEEYGYAGTIDVSAFKDGEFYILDFKTTKTTAGKPIEPKQGHPMQLAAYYQALHGNIDNIKAANVYISTNEIGRVDFVEYSKEELTKQWHGFEACLTLWRLANDYDPRITT